MSAITIEAPKADGESYGASEERSLLNLSKTYTSMWSFFGCKFLKGNIGSLWYELEARIVNKKALDVHLLLCLNWVEVFMAQDVEWVFCSMGGQKIPHVRVF
jgi:hypothetical protein